jgi:hypothetical protein
LDKSKKWADYFDSWGSRCYVFAAELENNWFEITKKYASDNNVRMIRNLSLNMEELKSMGGRYIFSAVDIVNAGENGLRLKKTFERDDSPWRIYLFEIE